MATCRGGAGDDVAVTVNSFCSVSLAPPLVSFALGHTARCLEPFLAAPRFAMHVLQSDQILVAKRFARPTGASWDGIGHHSTHSGYILLDQCAAVFLCERADVRDVGDHRVIFGRVEQFSCKTDAAPLTFCHGRYGSLELSRTGRSWFEELEPPGGQLGWG